MVAIVWTMGKTIDVTEMHWRKMATPDGQGTNGGDIAGFLDRPADGEYRRLSAVMQRPMRSTRRLGYEPIARDVNY